MSSFSMSLLIKYSYVLIWLRKCKLPTYFNQREMKIISKTLNIAKD